MMKPGRSSLEGKLRSLEMHKRDIELGAEVLAIVTARITGPHTALSYVSWHGPMDMVMAATDDLVRSQQAEYAERQRRMDLPFGGGVI